jgi:hypothetical protein
MEIYVVGVASSGVTILTNFVKVDELYAVLNLKEEHMIRQA